MAIDIALKNKATHKQPSSKESPDFSHGVCQKVDVAKGDYQRTKGVRSQQKLPKGKICGFKKFDKVLYLGNEYFIKGRMSKGSYAVLMDIDGNKIDFSYMPKGYKTPKLSKCSRLSARTSQIISCRFISHI